MLTNMCYSLQQGYIMLRNEILVIGHRTHMPKYPNIVIKILPFFVHFFAHQRTEALQGNIYHDFYGLNLWIALESLKRKQADMFLDKMNYANKVHFVSIFICTIISIIMTMIYVNVFSIYLVASVCGNCSA